MYLNEYASDSAQSGGRAPHAWMVPLLEPDQLIQAISGHMQSGFALVGWARELGDLHAELIPHKLDRASRPRNFDCEKVRAEIDRVVGEIDAWAASNAPRMEGARMHTHSLGEVMSHIAMAFADAWWTVLHSTDAELRHRAWLHLGQAREGYAEMVIEMRARRLRLPLGTSGIRRREVEPHAD
ncbi:hypothetical protein ACQP1G_26420 [Nocardia sp. CA-107356]|uniref:hypothetical protein n=1 Tax=Nocardia sp. CA-107356 TaxID=3239972 RepID=UPI003D8E9AF2